MKKTISFWLLILVLTTFFAACSTTSPSANQSLKSDVTTDTSASYVTEPQKKIPVIYDVDVAVAGGGVSGIFAALAAAREGASVVLIDRFGAIGGNMGPGMNSPGGDLRDRSHLMSKGAPKEWVFGKPAGLPKKFGEKFFALKASGRFLADANISVYVAFKMLKEAGVKLMLSTYVTDPIIKGNKVCGVFVENKSGRQAVKAKVVIDATGEADIARRAGASILYPKQEYNKLDSHAPTGMGIWAILAGIDPNIFDIRTAGNYRWPQKIGDLAEVNGGLERIGPDHEQIAGLKVNVVRRGCKVDAGDAEHISIMEAGTRMYVFEMVQKIKENVPGCENAYLLFIAPFLGARGGPCIEGEYTLTMEDCRQAKKFDDVIYVYGEPRALRYTCKQPEGCRWTDVPYRVMIPKKLEGLIAVGRNASGIPDTLLRNREGVMYMGQAGGTAAAIAVKEGVTPRNIDIKELQKKLFSVGFYLGDKNRLEKLGLN